MADQSDAANGLAGAVAAILAPNGSGVTTVTGSIVKIYPGWPDSATLQGDLAAGAAHVSVFATPLDQQQFVAMTDMGWKDGPIADGQGTTTRTLRRQTKVFAVTVWAATPAARDALASAVDAGLAALTRMTLTDGSLAPLAYKGSMQRDEAQKVMIYRRDINYAVTFDTVQSLAGYAVESTVVNVTGGNAEQPGPQGAAFGTPDGMPQPSADFSSQWNSSMKAVMP